MKNILLSLLIVILNFSCLQPAAGWSYHTHRKITADAVRLMPESFRNEFAGQKGHFLKGATDPDTLIKDFMNHVYHPDGSRVDGLYRIQAIHGKAVELIRSSAGPEKIAYILGLMSHYIADLNQPLHTAGSERNPDESLYHIKFERDLNPHLSEFALPEISYQPVTDIESRVKEMTTAANSEYGNIDSAYRSGANLAPVMEMAKRQIGISTRQVVDFWLGAFRDAGRNFSEAASAAQSADTSEWSSTEGSVSGDSDHININAATAEELAVFFNIAPVKAQRIVDSRPFSSAYDLAKVDGFTVHFVKRHRERIKLK